MIRVQAYDPVWVSHFLSLSDVIREATWSGIIIEHVGSTSIPGLAAKPIIDIDVIVDRDEVVRAIECLTMIGYRHRGNLGIEDREAFFNPKNIEINHHLYVCVEGVPAVQNHLILRDYLKSHPEIAQRYGALKLKLASSFSDDIDAYIDGKTSFITDILSQEGMKTSEVSVIKNANEIKR